MLTVVIAYMLTVVIAYMLTVVRSDSLHVDRSAAFFNIIIDHTPCCVHCMWAANSFLKPELLQRTDFIVK